MPRVGTGRVLSLQKRNIQDYTLLKCTQNYPPLRVNSDRRGKDCRRSRAALAKADAVGGMVLKNKRTPHRFACGLTPLPHRRSPPPRGKPTLKGSDKKPYNENDFRFSSSSWNAFIRDPGTTGAGHFTLFLVKLSVATNMRRNDEILHSFPVKERVAVQ